MFTLLANFAGTSLTAAAVAMALFSPGIEYTPEIYKVNMSMSQPIDITEDIGFYKVSPIKISQKDLQCLEKNIYYEAGIEDHAGKIAVAQVTWNRVKNGRWGKSICKVVYARKQFSWTHQNKPAPKGKLWRLSKQAAQDFINGTRILDLKNSLYYHATWMKKKPSWALHKIQVHEIGQHVFYMPKKK